LVFHIDRVEIEIVHVFPMLIVFVCSQNARSALVSRIPVPCVACLSVVLLCHANPVILQGRTILRFLTEPSHLIVCGRGWSVLPGAISHVILERSQCPFPMVVLVQIGSLTLVVLVRFAVSLVCVMNGFPMPSHPNSPAMVPLFPIATLDHSPGRVRVAPHGPYYTLSVLFLFVCVSGVYMCYEWFSNAISPHSPWSQLFPIAALDHSPGRVRVAPHGPSYTLSASTQRVCSSALNRLPVLCCLKISILVQIDRIAAGSLPAKPPLGVSVHQSAPQSTYSETNETVWQSMHIHTRTF
jgi:hypothetical protein